MTGAAARVGALLQQFTALLAGAGTTSPRLDAEVLLCHALGRERAWLFAHADDVLDPATLETATALVERRAGGEPVAYLVGTREFWSLPLAVTPATLIPRPETELLVELALERLPADDATTVADLGTGSGAIAVAIAAERPGVTVDATDASARALAVAARNVARHAAGRVRLLQGDWWQPLAGRRYALVVSNPPYVDGDDPHLDRGDPAREPREALTPGADGLAALRRIVESAPRHLLPGAWLLLEHGSGQGDAVRALLEAAGFDDVATFRDLAGHPRASGGRRP